jgi:hypothetical protein
MAFGLHTFASRTFLPRVFIDTVATVVVDEGEPGDFGPRAFTPFTFDLGTFSQQSLRGVGRIRTKKRMQPTGKLRDTRAPSTGFDLD